MELRKRTEEDCERILDEAQVTARQLKESRLAEAEEMLRKKEDELLRSTRENMNTRLARFEEDLLKEAARQRELLESELNDRRLQVETDHREQLELIQTLKTEASLLAEKRDQQAATLRASLESETKKLNDLTAERSAKLEQLSKLSAEVDQASQELARKSTDLSSLKIEIAAHQKTAEEARAATQRIRISQEEVDNQLLSIRNKFEEEKAKLHREEQKHLEELKLETTRKVAVLEQQLVEELLNKKDRLAREIGLMFETHVKEHPEMTPKICVRCKSNSIA